MRVDKERAGAKTGYTDNLQGHLQTSGSDGLDGVCKRRELFIVFAMTGAAVFAIIIAVIVLNLITMLVAPIEPTAIETNYHELRAIEVGTHRRSNSRHLTGRLYQDGPGSIH